MASILGNLFRNAAGGILNFGSTIAKALGGGGGKSVIGSIASSLGNWLIPQMSQATGASQKTLGDYYAKGTQYLQD